MINILLTITCSTSIGLILKENSIRSGNPVVLLCANYMIATVISWGFYLKSPVATSSYIILFFGLILGLFFVVTFFAFAKAVTIAGTSLAQVSSRLSVVVPITLSIIIFNEQPGLMQLIGFGFALITLIMFYRSLSDQQSHKLQASNLFYLMVVLIGIGINDFCMKLFQHWRPASEKPLFLTIIFSSAFLYTVAYIVFQQIKIDRSTILWGGMLGLPNIFSTYFLISALGSTPAIIVFPLVNIGVILFTAIGAFLIWRERINPYGRYALAAGVVAIFFLSF